MPQTVSFGLAANEYDAQSDGDFDELAVTAAAAEDGAVFIFECRDGEGSRQPARRLCVVPSTSSSISNLAATP
jgi:hypothetical protein